MSLRLIVQIVQIVKVVLGVFKMLNKILNLLPVNIVQKIGSSLVENLYQRDGIKNWEPAQETA